MVAHATRNKQRKFRNTHSHATGTNVLLLIKLYIRSNM